MGEGHPQRVPPAVAVCRVSKVSKGTEVVGQILHRVQQPWVHVVGDRQVSAIVGIQGTEVTDFQDDPSVGDLGYGV